MNFFFFNDTATTEIYTLSLHDALPICVVGGINDGLVPQLFINPTSFPSRMTQGKPKEMLASRSEEHTSELQSLRHLVCRLLLEKKKKTTTRTSTSSTFTINRS